MIPVMSSQELNDILMKAKEKISDIDASINTIKDNIDEKLLVIKHENSYMNKRFSELISGAYNQDETFSMLSNSQGQFETYGSTVHSKFIREPINIFNLKVSGTGEVFFRNDVDITINKNKKDTYKSILKHTASKDKKLFFEEFDNETLSIEILANKENPLGPTKFNVIEIDPFMPGSFDINYISIHNINSDGLIEQTPLEIKDIKKVGKSRIILPSKIDFYKIEINITIKHHEQSGDKKIYPFGLKHLYLYDADFRSDSFVLVNMLSNQFISIIKDIINIKTPIEDKSSTIDDEQIEIYLENTNGVLGTKVYPSTPTDRKEIARNTKTLYIKIPLMITKNSEKHYKSIIGINFNIETRN